MFCRFLGLSTIPMGHPKSSQLSQFAEQHTGLHQRLTGLGFLDKTRTFRTCPISRPGCLQMGRLHRRPVKRANSNRLRPKQQVFREVGNIRICQRTRNPRQGGLNMGKINAERAGVKLFLSFFVINHRYCGGHNIASEVA